MSTVKFIRNGFSLLSNASGGDYDGSNAELEALGNELFEDFHDSKRNPLHIVDRRRLSSDFKRVGADIRKAISLI
jgi:hypothetical protein